MALSAMLWPRSASSALPPPVAASAPASSAAPPAADRAPAGDASPDDDDPSLDWGWLLPPVRFGGNLSYDMRASSADERKAIQNGLAATLRAATDTYIWRPWFGRMGGVLNFTTSRTKSRYNDPADMFAQDHISSDSVMVTGNGNVRRMRHSMSAIWMACSS